MLNGVDWFVAVLVAITLSRNIRCADTLWELTVLKRTY